MTELCAKQGYIGTSVDQVIARAGVSAAQFDQLFGSKEECLLGADNALMGEVVGAVAGAYSADRSESDSYLIGTSAILELMAADPAKAHLGYIASRQMGPPRVRAAHRAGIQALTMMIERLWEYSANEAQPASAARGALGGPEAVVRRYICEVQAQELPRLLPDFIYAATVPFLGQAEALRLSRRARTLLRNTAQG